MVRKREWKKRNTANIEMKEQEREAGPRTLLMPLLFLYLIL